MTFESIQDVRSVLQHAQGPMTASQVQAAVVGRTNVAGAKRFAGELRKLLAEQPALPEIHVWPKYGVSQVYCSRPLRSLVEGALLRALEREPLTVPKGAKAVRKALRLISETRALTEVRAAGRDLAASKQLLLFAATRQSPILVSWVWLKAQAPAESPSEALEWMLPGVVQRLQPGAGNYVRVDRLRNAPEVRAVLDKAVIRLADRRQLVLARYDGPQPVPDDEKWDYVEDERGELFAGVALPRMERADER
jgi:hypothetical protein